MKKKALQFLEFAILGAALALPGLSFGRSLTETAKCVDFSVVGPELENQQSQYEEAKRPVEEAQEKGETPDLSDVADEVYYATQSWVKANCALLYGDILRQQGDKAGAREAYLAAKMWAEKAIVMGVETKDGKYPGKANSEGKIVLRYIQKRLGIKAVKAEDSE